MSCESVLFAQQPSLSSGALHPVGLRAPDATGCLGRVLIWLKPKYLGDAVMATSLVDELGRSYGERFVRCSPMIQELYADRSDSLSFLESTDIRQPFALAQYAKRLRSMGFDAVFLVDRSFRSALVAKLARIPVRIGHSTEGRGWLLTHPVVYRRRRFEADCYLDLLAACGIASEPARPCLSVSYGERRAGKQMLGDATIGICPGGRHNYKHLPYQTMAAVIFSLQKAGVHLALLGAKEDEKHVRELDRCGIAPCVNLVGKTTLREAAGVLANLKLVVGGDNGLMHMAAAIGTPTVAIFGKEPAAKWAHAYEPHIYIQAPHGNTNAVAANEVVSACGALLST